VFREALAGAQARRFFAAHAQSCLGTGLAYVALPLLAYVRFDSAWAISAVLLPDLLPAIVLGPLLGALVDRIGWRTCAAAADVLRCVAFLVIMRATSLPLMIAGATLSGLGTALFHPAALTGLPRLTPGGRRAAGMGLFGALDDLGLTLGPALAAVALAIVHARTLMLLNAVTFGVSAVLIGTLRGTALSPEARAELRPRMSLLGEARAGVRALLAVPSVRTLLASSTGVVLCVGVTNVGEVVLAREVLGVRGSGLATMIMSGGVGTVLGSLSARFTGAGESWVWRRAYFVGLMAMAVELLACAFVESFWLVLPALMLGGFGNGMALVHDRLLLTDSTPESLHGRLFALQKMCVSLAFAISFVVAGAVIVNGSVQLAFLLSALTMFGVMALAFPRLRAAWPHPDAPRTALPATR
jgi:MFS family permease